MLSCVKYSGITLVLLYQKSYTSIISGRDKSKSRLLIIVQERNFQRLTMRKEAVKLLVLQK